MGLVPKAYLPNYGEFYEQRWFASGSGVDHGIELCGQHVSLCTNQTFACDTMPNLVIGVEICEDLWAPAPPSVELARKGATVILNLSASNELVGKADYRRALVTGQSARLMCGYVYADAGEGETRTNLKVIDPAGHTNTDINEPGPAVAAKVLESLLERLTGSVRAGDIVVLAGSLPVGAPQDTYRTWTAACRQAGAKVFLDADGAPLAAGIEARPYLVKPNEHELARLLGRELGGVGELRAAAGELLAAGVEKVVVSLGSRGALYATKTQVILADGLPVKVGSTVGAGDSVVAALAWAEEQGLSLEEAAVLSTATGAANVMCSGTQAADAETVRALMPRVTWRTL